MTADSWANLKQFTAARIALGRAGASLPTAERLAIQLAVARARDAVVTPFDPHAFAAQWPPPSPQVLSTRAANRATHLVRPDLGRRLTEASVADLEILKKAGPWDLVIIVADGLSTLAVGRQARPFLEVLLPKLAAVQWRVAPLLVIANARVAVQDEIGEILRASLSLILLGERPGLGAPDSLGAYFTFAPRMGRTDADRNCVSNIRPEGLPPAAAAEKLFYLLTQSRRQQVSGVPLKDDSPPLRATASPARLT